MARTSTDSTADGRKRSGFPAPISILLLVLLLVWAATFFIPAGQYQLDASGSPIAGSFQHIAPPLDLEGRIRDLLLAPVNGLYGIQDPATGQVGPFNSGIMFGSVQVFLFILAIGGFMTVVFATGALDRGIHHLAYAFRARGPVLIVVLSLLFGVLGSVMAWSDETLGLYALMVPLMIALGYDRMVAVAVVSIAPFAGQIGSTINPFVIGIGSAKAGITIGDGIELRLVLFVTMMTVTIAYTLWYAKRHQARPDPVAGRDRRRGRGAAAGGRQGPGAADGAAYADHRAGRLHLRAAHLLDHPLGCDPGQRRGRPLHARIHQHAVPVGTRLVAAGALGAVPGHGDRDRGGRRPGRGRHGQGADQGHDRLHRPGVPGAARARRGRGHDQHQDHRHRAERDGGPGHRDVEHGLRRPDLPRSPCPSRSWSAAARRARR